MRNLDVNNYVLPVGVVLCGTVLVTASRDSALMPRNLIWCLLTAILFYTNKVKIGKVHFFALGFLGCVLLSGIQAINKSEWMYAVTGVFLAVVFLSVVRVDMKLLSKAVVLLGVIFIVYFWWDYSHIGIFKQCRGLMRQRNIWAAAHFLVLPFCWYLIKDNRWKWFSVFIASMMALNICLLQSRSVMLALIISSFVFDKRIGLLLVIAATYYAFINTAALQYAFHLRWVQWEATFDMIKANPWGVGAGNWMIQFPEYSQGVDFPRAHSYVNFRFPHNDFLWIWAETGIIGIACYVGMILTAMKNASKPILLGLIGYVVIASFSAPHERPFTSLMLMVLIASACNMTYTLKRPDIVLTGLIFCAIVFGFRLKSHIHSKLMRNDIPKIAYHAGRAYSPFSKIDLDGYPWFWWIGTVSLANKDYYTAHKQFELGHEQSPYKVFSLNSMGIIHIAVGEPKEAKTYFDKALLIAPHCQEVQGNLERLSNVN